MKKNPPNQHRQSGPNMGDWNSTPADGMNGAFAIPISYFPDKNKALIANCIVSNGEGAPEPYCQWEHVSVHIMDHGVQRIPTWKEMCRIKDIFWDEEEEVVQYHPAKSNYVNCHPCVLHLWRHKPGFPTPPTIMV